MQETTYTCDKCDHYSTDSGFVHLVKINVRYRDYRVDLCRPCGVLLGLISSKEKDPPAPDPAPTALTLLTELVQLAIDSGELVIEP